jgi:alkyl sulfatase BDS1-like metallo-beta-lactamase superfamily hydrolase
VDAKAKNIAQEVVSRRDATKYVIVLPREVCGIVQCCVG